MTKQSTKTRLFHDFRYSGKNLALCLLTTVKTERHPNSSMKLYRFYLKRHQNAFGGRAPPGLKKRGTSLNRPLRNSTYPLVTRDLVLPKIIYACHYGIFKQESRAVARKPCDAAAVLFGLKFTDDIHYKFKSSQALKARLQSSKHTGTKQNLTQNGDSRSLKVACFNRLRYFATYQVLSISARFSAQCTEY